MNLVKNNASCDKVIWLCHERNPKHDTTFNIRLESVFEGFQIKIQILYFLLFYCKSENITINCDYEKCKEFCEQIGVDNISKDSISKFYRVVRNKLRERMHAKWRKSFLEVEINPEFGYRAVEIDESKIISSGIDIYWMFFLVDRNNKEVRIFTVLNNTTKNKLLPLVKNNVFTPQEEDYMDIDNDNNQIIEERFSIKTIVFSNSFSSYQQSDFINLVLILKSVNHSVWFGIGSLHTNTIESLWHQVKSITNNFMGLSTELLKKTFNNDESEITKYLDAWLC